MRRWVGSLSDRVMKYGLRRLWRKDLEVFTAQHFSLALIIEISISYLGFGIQEPWPSFGRLLAENLSRVFQGY